MGLPVINDFFVIFPGYRPRPPGPPVCPVRAQLLPAPLHLPGRGAGHPRRRRRRSHPAPALPARRGRSRQEGVQVN